MCRRLSSLLCHKWPESGTPQLISKPLGRRIKTAVAWVSSDPLACYRSFQPTPSPPLRVAITEAHIEQAKAIARSYGATRVILFGRAQTDPAAARDLDLAIGGVPGWTIWKLAAELEEAIDRPLDVVPLEPSTPFTRRIEARGEVLFERE